MYFQQGKLLSAQSIRDPYSAKSLAPSRLSHVTWPCLFDVTTIPWTPSLAAHHSWALDHFCCFDCHFSVLLKWLYCPLFTSYWPGWSSCLGALYTLRYLIITSSLLHGWLHFLPLSFSCLHPLAERFASPLPFWVFLRLTAHQQLYFSYRDSDPVYVRFVSIFRVEMSYWCVFI